ncbi:hypothetical protein [Dokdonia sp.]|uniref:hypothetical protein n=1 Tax=Dokdonia sp. TaxID=2024995 RepID=UPI00326410B6
MKFLKNTPLLLLTVFLLFSACRTEDEEIISPPAEQVLAANSNAANLITRVSTNDGSNDNILDNANCLSIQLPVTVVIDGLEIIIDSEEDFDTIEDIFDEFGDDIDELDFIFPITIILSDFTEIVINDVSELETLIEDCTGENEEDEDIECIDFQYPITYSVFSQNNELIETVTIANDEAHYEFIDNLDDTDIVSINFPLTLILSNGETVTANDILELENIIEEAIDDCDEDDDNDIDDDDCEDCDDSSLIEIFDACDTGFIIDEFIQNGDNSTQQYYGAVFEFNSDGTVIVAFNGTVFEGTWSTSGSGNDITFELSIPGLPDFNDVWDIIEIEDEEDEDLSFIITNGEDYINFNCNEEDEEEDFDCPDLEANIGDDCENPNGNDGTINQDCECVVEEEEDFDCPNLEANIGDACENQNGNDGTINQDCECIVEDNPFDCPDLQANIGDSCIDPDGNNGTIDGDCECVVEEEDFDCPNLEANIGDACENPNGNDGTINQNCECVEDGEENSTLESTLLNGDWIGVTNSPNGNLVVILQNFTFNFNENNIVIATDSNGDVNGFWDVSENDAFFELEFPTDSSGLSLLNNVYTVISIEEDRIELAFNNNLSLVFEKI